MPAQKFRNPITAAAGMAVDELFKANGASDLSGCQYRFVALGTVAGEIVGATGASNPFPIGILQNGPAASGVALVRLFGRSQLKFPASPCSMVTGEFITSTGCGGGTSMAACGGVALGRYLSADAGSGVAATCTVFVNCLLPSASLGFER